MADDCGCAVEFLTRDDAWVAGVRARQQGLPLQQRPDFGGRAALIREWELGWHDGEPGPGPTASVAA